MPRPEAKDISAWGDRSANWPLLPELVRRLVHATTHPNDLVEVDFPAGDGVQRTGPDGRIRALVGTADVPEGASLWELGCN